MTKIAFDKSGHETKASVLRRIADKWGFQYKRIVPMEADSYEGVYTSISFQVAGIGYWTDFETLERMEIWDAA